MSIIYFPIISNSKEIEIGVDANPATEEDLIKIRNSDITLVTVGQNLNWKYYEPNPNVYNEDYFLDFKAKVNRIKENGLIPIVTISGAPVWSQIDPPNSRIKEEYFPNFKNFVEKAIKELDVNYIQIWNEADMYSGDIDYYGCWGDKESFQKLLNIIYPLREKYTVQFSISIAFNPEFLNELTNYDIVNIHKYQWYHYPYIFHSIDNYVVEVRSNTDKEVWLTETNLLNTDTNEVYEETKCKFMEDIVNNAKELKIPVLIFYSWESGWNEANIRNLPAEEKLKELR